jgi:hypothetical protein
MLQGNAYDCNPIECLVLNELLVTKDKKTKKMETRRFNSMYMLQGKFDEQSLLQKWGVVH